ncbi:uncharacterized protein LOC110841004, partial [Zootermopsis nevadensis]|uniref:uncharacterized protein LOC110841004 n=1 Tax=Zootermopsis nevadensis TaxID=136037 RepID=UPI000B8E3747
MPRTPPSSAGRVFSRDDIEAMLQLEVILRGDARIAMKMAAQLKSKTAKQIRDKRREPIYIAKRNALLKKTAPTDPGPSMASPSGEQGGITTVETPKDVYEQANALELEPASDMQGECTQPRDVQTSAALPENNRNTTQDGNSKWESEITQPGDWNPPAGHPTTIIPIMGSQDDIARGGGSELELGTDQSEITQPGDWNPPAGHPTTIIPIMGSQDDIARGGSSELELGTDQLCDCIPSADHINEYEDTDNIWRESLRESLLELGGDRFSKDAAELVGNIKKSVVAGNLSQEVINETYSAVLDFLRPKHTSSSTTSQSCPKHSKTKGKKRKRALKRFKYAITQNLFKKNPALLAKQVRMGTDLSAQNGAQLPREEVEHLYNILWSTTPSLRLPDYVETPDPISLDLFLGELKQEEVYKRLGKMKRSTAAGPDGIKPDALGNKVSRRVLCALYNLILLSGHLPSAWRQNRTTLIPKEGKDATKAVNYRPITISSVLSRLFWGIINQRLGTVVRQSPRQKGFVAEAGCFANIQILTELVRRMKRDKGGVGIQLDVSKAFDTIPHEAIGPALTRKGLPSRFVDLV